MKLIWQMGDKPTGRYRSFTKRAWPTVFHDVVDGEIAGMLMPVVDQAYEPKIAESTLLKVRVADHSCKPWEWRMLKKQFVGMKAAKQGLLNFLNANPQYKGLTTKEKNDG